MVTVSACSAIGVSEHANNDPSPTSPTEAPPGPNAPGLKWVALGDSYSAGVGADGTGGCGDGFPKAAFGAAAGWRFAQAWPNLVSQVSIASCGGAVIKDITGSADGTIANGSPSPDSQLAWAQRADVATMTIGGNDAGFGAFGIECFVPTPKNDFGKDCPDVSGDDPDALYTLMQTDRASVHDPAGIWHWFEQRLANAYASVVRTMAPGGQLIVLTYPIPFSIDHLSQSCGQTLGGLVSIGLTKVVTSLNPFAAVASAAKVLLTPLMDSYLFLLSTNALKANIFAERLDETIVSAVRDAATEPDIGNRVHLVDWRTHYGPPQLRTMTVGNTQELVADNPSGVCQSDGAADVNFISINPGDERDVNSDRFALLGDSFHPTQTGYETVLGQILTTLEVLYPYGGADARHRGASPSQPFTCVVNPETDRHQDFPTCQRPA
jgi:hypothetical protein